MYSLKFKPKKKTQLNKVYLCNEFKPAAPEILFFLGGGLGLGFECCCCWGGGGLREEETENKSADIIWTLGFDRYMIQMQEQHKKGLENK